MITETALDKGQTYYIYRENFKIFTYFDKTPHFHKTITMV